MKNPLKDWKHWFVWLILTLGITFTTYGFTKIVNVYVRVSWFVVLFISWFITLACLDWLMHKLGWQ